MFWGFCRLLNTPVGICEAWFRIGFLSKLITPMCGRLSKASGGISGIWLSARYNVVSFGRPAKAPGSTCEIWLLARYNVVSFGRPAKAPGNICEIWLLPRNNAVSSGRYLKALVGIWVNLLSVRINSLSFGRLANARSGKELKPLEDKFKTTTWFFSQAATPRSFQVQTSLFSGMEKAWLLWI